MNNKLAGILSKYVGASFVFWITFIVIRIFEAITLLLKHSSEQSLFVFELRGILFDTATVLLLSSISLFPYIAISYIKSAFSNGFLILCHLVLCLLYIVLSKVFIIQLIPVDQVIFTYTISDLWLAVTSSTSETWTTFIPILLLLLMYFFLLKKLSYRNINKRVVYAFVLCCILILPFYKISYYERHPGQFKNFVINNKLSYFIHNSILYYKDVKQMEKIIDIAQETKLHEQYNPQWKFTNTAYPFLHKATNEDVLGPFFKLNDTQKPNIIFIIVESLSRSFMGKDSRYGSFTPFLDSLSQHSLYFPNFLSTAERTFNVLPSSLGSLPYSQKGFMELGLKRKLPYHFTSIQLLKEQGYYTRFYVGSVPYFNNMDGFLNEQNIDYIAQNWDKKYMLPNKDKDNWSWGYHDGDLYGKSMEDLGKHPIKEERFDIYLTISSHGPFIPPNQKYYNAIFEKQMNVLEFDNVKKGNYRKDANKFESILYTDNALRDFLKQYQERPEYQNSIFFIFGDHAMPEIHYNFPSIEKYHIPLIIYSPMLKRSKRIEAVSSHLDLTPSLLALIKNKYNINFPKEVAWIGNGLDTNAQFQNNHSIPFMHNNKKLVEYMYQNYFLSFDDLYEVKPGLVTVIIKNKAKRKEMIDRLANFIKLNYYTTLSDKIIPKELYEQFAGSIKTEYVITIPNVETKNPVVQQKMVLSHPYKINDALTAVLIENNFDFYVTDTLFYHEPIVVAIVKNAEGIIIKKIPMEILEKNNVKMTPKTWNKATCGTYINLLPFKNRKGYSLYLEIINKDECPSYYRNWKFELKGVK